jgi:hypothetical protein
MARINRRRIGRQAASQSRAEYLPQKNSVRRSVHNQVAALRSEEDPLNTGLENAARTVRHSNLSAADKAQLLQSFAQRQANIPAGIASQVLGVREAGQGEVADLRQEQAASRGSIMQQLLGAAQQRQEEAQAAIATEQRQSAGAIKQAELEKSLGLGDYATPTKTPLEEAQETADLAGTEADTAKTQAEAAGGGLTPYQHLERQESHQEDHDNAATWAKALLEGAKEEGKVGEPKDWTSDTWNHLVTATSVKAKVPIPVAEKAVGAIRDHFEPQTGGGLVGHLAEAAAGAITNSGAGPTAAAPAGLDPSALLKLLPAAHAGRY